MRKFSVNKDETSVMRELRSQTRLIKKIEFYVRYFVLISIISISIIMFIFIQ